MPDEHGDTKADEKEVREEDAKEGHGKPADEDQKQTQVPGAGESHGLAPKKH